MDQEILKVFFYDGRCAVVMDFSAWKRSLLRWRQTAVRRRFVWDELDYRVDVCRIIKGAPVRYVTKTWSVVLLNKKIQTLLSQVYCV
jgi:hypothetical protein